MSACGPELADGTSADGAGPLPIPDIRWVAQWSPKAQGKHIQLNRNMGDGWIVDTHPEDDHVYIVAGGVGRLGFYRIRWKFRI